MSNYLMHYGVKGMKWGVHRYKDKTGRLTQEGRDHYAALSKKYSPKVLEAQKRTGRVESTGDNYDKAMATLSQDRKARIKEERKIFKEYGMPEAMKRRANAKTVEELLRAHNDIDSIRAQVYSDPRTKKLLTGFADKQIEVLGEAIAKDLKIKNKNEVKDYVSIVLDSEANVWYPTLRTSNNERVSVNPYLWRTYNKLNNID